MTVDTTTLTETINRCFDYSMDGRLTPARQTKYLTQGKRLRGHLLNLISARFEDGTQAVIDANAKLKEVNAQLKDSVASLERAAEVLANIAKLVKVLDGLLGIAASFV